MLNSYASILTDCPQRLAESPHIYQYFTERHIQAIWFEQKYFKNLQTSSGERIEVLSPGIWNAEAGPDFLKAHLRIGDREILGDVEIHLLDESWYQHNHHKDERYDQVVFHLSLWKPKQEKLLITKSGHIISQAYLEHCFTIPQARILQLIDLDLYPYKRFLGSGRCAHALFRNLPEHKIHTFFQHAAEWRLMQKRNYLQERISDQAMQLGAGMAMTLGYKNNAEAFLELFSWLYTLPFTNEEEWLAVGMLVFGFFSDSFKKKWKTSEQYQHLSEIAAQVTPLNAPTIKLVLNQIRPLNHPIRRLVVMAKLLSDATLPTLYERMSQYWEARWPSCRNKKDWKTLFDELRDFLPTYQDEYWNRHYTFETEPRKEFLSLMGEDLKNEMLTNIFMPLHHHAITQRGSPEEMRAFRELYLSLPAANNSKTRYLIHRFFGETPKGSILNKAYTEQGAYQLHRDFCLHFEASCEGCPFVDRMKELP